MKRKGVMLALTFSLFSSCTKKSPEETFWSWFVTNEDRLFHFEQDRERTFDALKAALREVHGDLTFEFGPIADDKREFVISAGGLRNGFPAVESLCAAAPSLPRWVIIQFHPRRAPMELRFGGLTIQPTDIEVAIEADGDKAGFTVFVRGFREEERRKFSQAAFLMLDQAIGEYDMETKVGFVEVKPFDEDTALQRHALKDLPRVFDEFLRR